MEARERATDPGAGPLAGPYGQRMAAVLVGAWRPSPPALRMAGSALDAVVDGLLRSNTGGLGWWRVRHSPLRTSPAGRRLRQAYHAHGLEATLHERDLARALTRLRAAGVEPLLVKGSAIARLYAERALRPFGDLDLCVRPDQYDVAVAALRDWGERLSALDLHRGLANLDSRPWETLYARAEIVAIGGLEVRIPGPEDHLRLLCLHLLRHGATNPIWLCDVAAAVESRPPRFDWDRCLGPDRRRADWVACTIGLAHQLLGLAVDDTPTADRARRLPPWLVPSVIERWATYYAAAPRPRACRPGAWQRLAQVPGAIGRYWPSPVAASVHLGRSFGGLPRAPIQLVDAFARLGRYVGRRLSGQPPGGTPH